jgi:hypothetical protein
LPMFVLSLSWQNDNLWYKNGSKETFAPVLGPPRSHDRPAEIANFSLHFSDVRPEPVLANDRF